MVIVINKHDDIHDILPVLESLWTILEEYYKMGKLTSIGVSDIDTEKFIQLFKRAKVR
jgi:glutamate--cysteine ligase regulatory subunit